MANMAADSWLPHRFSHLSDRLTMQNGVMLISGAAILTLLYTWGDTSTLVLMYSINVFLTFSLSETGMVLYWFGHRERYPDWGRHIVIHVIGLVLCLSILTISVYEKFLEGGWVTIALTTALVGFCLYIRNHYNRAERGLSRLDEMMMELPVAGNGAPTRVLDADAPTAACFVKDYNGLGIQSVLAVPLLFGTPVRELRGTRGGHDRLQPLQGRRGDRELATAHRRGAQELRGPAQSARLSR
jgi:Amino acid permease